VVGVFIMVMVLEPSALQEDLTPVATAGEVFLTWLPGQTGLILVVIAAIAAFASTANAGIMSAARYPLAMARDRIISEKFASLGRFNTPTLSTVATTLTMIVLILMFNVDSVAKLASAFQLLLFGILNVSVIVMRESEIDGYDPGFRSPWYPWMQIAGFFISAYLIAQMGFLSIVFTLAIILLSVVWYFNYSKGKIKRQGAIYHVHARLGRHQYKGLESEMRGIMREKGLRKEDPYEKAIGRAAVFDLKKSPVIEEIIERVCRELSTRVNYSKSELVELFESDYQDGIIPIGNASALQHIRIDDDVDTEIALVRLYEGIEMDREEFDEISSEEEKDGLIHCLIYLISSKKKSGQHLRIIAHLAEMIDSIDFYERWMSAEDEAHLREILLRDERFINITLKKHDITSTMIDKSVKDLELPGESLITLIKRDGKIIFPHGKSTLKENDELSIIGDKSDIKEMKKMMNRDESGQ
jgi:K+/H+ antiporter YhaU regulatory subunit KhtT